MSEAAAFWTRWRGAASVDAAYSSSQCTLPHRYGNSHDIGSHSVTCHPAEVTFPPLPQTKLVFDLVTPEGCKAELT